MPAGIQEFLVNDVDSIIEKDKIAQSVVIVREPQHVDNLSGGRETLIPSRFLYGLIPDALLDAYSFWQDESDSPLEESRRDVTRGYRRLCGYPNADDGDYLIYAEIVHHGSWNDLSPESQTKCNEVNILSTGFPGATVRLIRRPKSLCEYEFGLCKRIAATLEQYNLLRSTSKEGKSIIDGSSDSLMKFKVDDTVECDFEGKGEFWSCVVRRVNDDNSYDLEFINVSFSLLFLVCFMAV
jgi:hypothetical protein